MAAPLFTSFGFLLILMAANAAKYNYSGIGETRQHWNTDAKDDLRRARQKPNVGVAKNVILFLGDGMGVSTVTAARILKGQLVGRPGEEEKLSFEKFPYVGLSKTYNQDAQTPDSAGTATAFLSGVKTNSGILGLDARARYGDCASVPGTELDSILHWAQEKGKSVGLVTTTRVTHATPAALYARTPARSWENDWDMIDRGVTPGNCTDIAAQLVDDNIDIKVILGGGRRRFMRNNDTDPELNYTSSSARSDGRNLIQEWQKKQDELGRSNSYVWNASAFNDVDPETTDYLLGLFSHTHMQYVLDRDDDVGGEPSLVDMTEKALKILARDPDGFFLLVEGGRIDHGHHASRARKALQETVEFSDAVAKAGELTSDQDTLTIVTADHSHVFTVGGYSSRGNPILGLADDGSGVIDIASDDKPYTSLQYANGPGAYSTTDGALRPDITNDTLDDKNYQQQSGVPRSSETHAGEDVAIYARGPMSHLIHGVHEQSYIAHVMAYASCMGAYSEPSTCAMADVDDELNTNDGVGFRANVLTALVCMFNIILLNNPQF